MASSLPPLVDVSAIDGLNCVNLIEKAAAQKGVHRWETAGGETEYTNTGGLTSGTGGNFDNFIWHFMQNANELLVYEIVKNPTNTKHPTYCARLGGRQQVDPTPPSSLSLWGVFCPTNAFKAAYLSSLGLGCSRFRSR